MSSGYLLTYSRPVESVVIVAMMASPLNGFPISAVDGGYKITIPASHVPAFIKRLQMAYDDATSSEQEQSALIGA